MQYLESYRDKLIFEQILYRPEYVRHDAGDMTVGIKLGEKINFSCKW
jgi:hypothetical protein